VSEKILLQRRAGKAPPFARLIFGRGRKPALVLNQTAQIFDLTGVARVADSFAQLKADYERNSAARAAMLSTAIFNAK
jgi:hypothetical protein